MHSEAIHTQKCLLKAWADLNIKGTYSTNLHHTWRMQSRGRDYPTVYFKNIIDNNAYYTVMKNIINRHTFGFLAFHTSQKAHLAYKQQMYHLQKTWRDYEVKNPFYRLHTTSEENIPYKSNRNMLMMSMLRP